MNCSRPAPDPVGLYDMFLPGQSWPQTWLNIATAFCWAVDPSAVMLVLPPQSAAPVGAAPVGTLSSLPQPANTSAATAATDTLPNALPKPSNFTCPTFASMPLL